jgi:hypothetical protein
MQIIKKSFLLIYLIIFCSCCLIPCFSQPVWNLANKNKDNLRITTLFTAGNVRTYLSTDEGINEAIDWCKNTGVTRVFMETFRGGYTAERRTLEQTKKMFESAGIEASGCVTTTGMGKLSSIGGKLCCYTNNETQKELQRIFEFTASILDLIMIDDFFHWRGYDVVRETSLYDLIWVGTETRDYDYYINDNSGEVQYNAYFIMRWLGSIGGTKTSGGRIVRSIIVIVFNLFPVKTT